MSVVTVSPKYQVVIPKEIRDELHWEAGAELELISTPDNFDSPCPDRNQ